jgi:predicted PurR-regulated permease PerM
VLLAIFCFGFAFGLVGLIFAVPLMIVLKVLGRMTVDAYRSHPWFGGDPSALIQDPSRTPGDT